MCLKLALINKCFVQKHKDRNDLAVYKLDKPIKFSEKVYPICLPKVLIQYNM